MDHLSFAPGPGTPTEQDSGGMGQPLTSGSPGFPAHQHWEATLSPAELKLAKEHLSQVAECFAHLSWWW